MPTTTTITEKTHISIPMHLAIPAIVFMVACVFGAATWMTKIQLQLDPLAEKIEHNDDRLERIADQQYKTCLAIAMIQQYTVPERHRTRVDCERVR